MTSAGARTLGLLARGRTRAVVNAHEIITGEFTRDRGFALPADRLTLALRARLGEDGLRMLDATRLAERLLGDAIHANVLMLGAAWQAGLLPLGEAALMRAIALNGADVEGNARAFAIGRWALAFPADAAAAVAAEPPEADDLEAAVARRAAHLTEYQGRRLSRRYRERIAAAARVDRDFADAMARGYHKLLSYKDEYEVARLHATTLEAAVTEQFTDVRAMRFHLAPPILGRRDASGRPAKRTFGPWILRVFAVLRRLKFLRGTPFDPFGYSAERKMERALIREYERDMDRIEAGLTAETRAAAIELAALPLADPRLRSREGSGGRGGGAAARGAARALRRGRAAGVARGGIGEGMRSLMLLPALLVAACASGVPVERQVVVPGGRFEAVRGEAALTVRSFLAGDERREVLGADCDVVSSLYSAKLVTPSRLVVPNFGPQSPELTVSCRAGDLTGSGRVRIITRWQGPPGYWGYPGDPFWPGTPYGWGWGWGGPGIPVSDYPNLNVTMR